MFHTEKILYYNCFLKLRTNVCKITNIMLIIIILEITNRWRKETGGTIAHAVKKKEKKKE